MRCALLAAFVAATALMGGCAQMTLGTPVATVDNVQKAKTTGMAPASLGEFALAAGKPRGMDESLSVRGNSLKSPYQNSFAAYLKEALAVELRSAGVLDPASKTVVQGWLTDNLVDASMGTGRGRLAARFVVVRAGKTVYDRELDASASWESSFVGASAIPTAVNEYSGLYRKLVGKLLDDKAFRAAVAAG